MRVEHHVNYGPVVLFGGGPPVREEALAVGEGRVIRGETGRYVEELLRRLEVQWSRVRAVGARGRLCSPDADFCGH